jgi:hypothetical protein
MTDAAAPARALRWLPTPAVLLVVAASAVLLFATLAKGLQDADYFWHITTGRLIATSAQVPSTDPFSFTWGGQPWVLHEWLGQLLIHALVSALGEWVALAVFGMLPGAALAIVAWSLRSRDVRVAAIGVALGLPVVVFLPYVTIRPQAISWLLLAGLVAFLWWLDARRPVWTLALGPFFALWANLHGLWVVGLGVLVTYTLFTLIRRTRMASAPLWLLGGLALAVVGTALTPAGPEGVLYPLRYLEGGNWGLANIVEWQSPDFRAPAHWGLLALIVAIGLNGGRATPGWLVALSWIGVVMSLVALRNAPMAAIFAIPTLALGVDARLGERSRRRGERPESVQLARRLMEVGLALVVIVGSALVALPRSPGVEPDPARLPVAGTDALVAANPEARVLGEYGWGGYLIWRLYDGGGRVFVDGRNDMYDDRILDDYSTIRAAENGWAELLERYGVEAILLPPVAPLVRGEAQAGGWCEAFRDERQVLLLRECPASGPSGSTADPRPVRAPAARPGG